MDVRNENLELIALVDSVEGAGGEGSSWTEYSGTPLDPSTYVPLAP